MDNSVLQEILKDDFETHKDFLNRHKLMYDSDWEDYHQLNNALQCGQKELAKLLILGGARVNRNDDIAYRVRRPLHLAVYLGCSEIVQMLLDKGASINTKNGNNETPLILAAKFRKDHILDLMLSVTDQKNCLNYEKFSHMHVACIRNRVDVVKKLIQMGAPLNDKVKRKSLYWPGFTALHFAVEFQCFETVEFLLKSGADIAAKDAAGLTPLHRAHMIRNEPIIDLILLHHKYELKNPVDPEGLSHFHIACTRNEPSVVENFIKWGADINATTSSSVWTPWHNYRPIYFAIEFGGIEIVKLLLTYNVNLDVSLKLEDNLIQHAFKTGMKEIADLLLYESSIQKADHSEILKKDTSIEDHLSKLHTITLDDSCNGPLELTALHLAIKNKLPKATKLLLERDSRDVVTASAHMRGKTPLHLAFETKQTKLVNLILSAYKDFHKNPSDDDDLSHFHIACSRNKPEIVERFLQNGVEVNAQVRMDSVFWPGYSALHFAIESKALDVVNLLLRAGASMTLKNGNDLTPLDIAILNINFSKCDDFNEVKRNFIRYDEILRSAASFDSLVDYRGFTPLHVASVNNDVSAIEQFLDLHPDLINEPINWPASEWHGYTPLHFAVYFNCQAADHILLQRGGDASAINHAGDTPLHIIHNDYENLIVDDLSCIKLFFTGNNLVGYKGFSHFHVACHFTHLEAVRHLLDLGVDVNQPTQLTEVHEYVGQTPLHLACHSFYGRKNSALVPLLLDRGAEINARDVELNTPLHCAIQNSFNEDTGILLSRGADVAARNMYGMTPLHSAINSCDMQVDGDISLKIELLLEHGADINDEGKDGQTALSGRRDDMIVDYRISLTAMMKHVKKLQIIGYHVSEKNRIEYKDLMDSIQGEEIWYDEGVHVQSCLEELARMSRTNVDGYTTLCDILRKDPNGLALHSQNATFRKLVESPESLKREYPIYGYLLGLQLKKGLERRPLLEEAKNVLNRLIGSRSMMMPVVCLEWILKSFSDDDLKNVIDAAKAA